MRKITKSDHLERTPGIDDLANQLKSSSNPQLVARIAREYWFSVEYIAWIDGRWYGCVQYYDEGWDTTDVGAYGADQAFGAFSKTARPDREETLQLVPRGDTPL